MVPEIFVCYSRRNKKRVMNIIKWLSDNGIGIESFFIDQGSIDGAVKFTELIADGIDNCKVFLYFISSASINSKWVEKEVFYASQADKIILPVFMDNLELPRRQKLELGSRNAIYLFKGDKTANYHAIKKSLHIHSKGLIYNQIIPELINTVTKKESKELINEEDTHIQERTEKLRNLSLKLKSDEEIKREEEIPAYKRKKIRLKRIISSNESAMSSYILASDDDIRKIEIKSNNSFLHEKVD